MSARLISFENSSILTPNFTSLSDSYFSKAEFGQEISINATWDGSIPLKVIPSEFATKVASSTSVEIAEIIAFRSSDPLVLAENTKAKSSVLEFQLKVMRNYAMYNCILCIDKIVLLVHLHFLSAASTKLLRYYHISHNRF